MRQLSRHLSLPSALLVLLAGAPRWSTAAADFGFDELPALPTSPADLRVLHRRHVHIEQRLTHQAPVAVRKMSEDPAEKFFPEYWTFGAGDGHVGEEEVLSTGLDNAEDKNRIPSHRTTRPIQERDSSNNSVSNNNFLPPILLHSQESSAAVIDIRGLGRNVLDKRGYMCPVGYHSCSSIGWRNSCCATGETCDFIQNTGIGVVGCCPAGQACKGSVSSCDVANGYRSCPHQRNKNGCCAPGFKCDAIGCIKTVGGATISTTRQVTVVETSPATVQVTTKTVYQTSVIGPTESTVYITTTYPTETKIVGPVIESNSNVVMTTVTQVAPSEATTETIGGVCPIGYYRCSAFYLGGCCRVGRDCHSTHCPARASTEAAANGVVTVIVATGLGMTTITEGTYTVFTSSDPVGAATATPIANGPCALGWWRCGVTGGGGCCPDGFSCAASCIATQSGLPGKVLKAPPTNQASVLEERIGLLLGIAVAAALGMVWL